MDNNQQRLVIGVLVLGLVVGFAAGWLVFTKLLLPVTPVSDSSDLNIKTNTPSNTSLSAALSPITAQSPVVQGDGSISIQDQTAGGRVQIASVTLQDTGWVAIREDRDGVFGNILGARYLPAGTDTNISIDLLRSTEPGVTYYAVLYKDDGDKVFDYQKDPIVQTESSVVFSAFHTLP